MKIYEGQNVLIKCWCNEPEGGALEQAQNLTKLPFIFKQVCLMPDTHQGYGMPIGGVIACRGAVIPNAVGVDIGCGMIAVKTEALVENVTTEELKEIMSLIRKAVPVGFNHHKEKIEHSLFNEAPDIAVINQEKENAKKQIGTLGGGNHFIEIQRGSDGYLWFMIHSGSRNFGYKIAKHYNKLAQELCTRWYSNIPPLKGEDGLAFLPIGSREAREYIDAMNFALKFAYENRKLMMREVLKAAYDIIGCDSVEEINIHHNYATMENHFGSNVWVHRKGATSARAGQMGIIPGSQGTSSYIVVGKGNPESFNSCSHGAGRKMSRGKARATLDLDEETKKLNDKGIIHSIRTKKELDEASGAYKDIDIVMEEQKDLVDIYVKLEPLAVIKG